MTGAVRIIPSRPIGPPAPKTAFGSKIRARRFVSGNAWHNRLYGKEINRIWSYDPAGSHILGNTIGNAVAGSISGSQDTSAQALQVPQPTVTYTSGGVQYAQAGGATSAFTPPTAIEAEDGSTQYTPGQLTVTLADGTTSTTSVNVRALDQSGGVTPPTGDGSSATLVTAIPTTENGNSNLESKLQAMSYSNSENIFHPIDNAWVASQVQFESQNPGYTLSLVAAETDLAVNINLTGNYAPIVFGNGNVQAGATLSAAAIGGVGGSGQLSAVVNAPSALHPGDFGVVVTLQGAYGAAIGKYVGGGLGVTGQYAKTVPNTIFDWGTSSYAEADSAFGLAQGSASATVDYKGNVTSAGISKAGLGPGEGGGAFVGFQGSTTLTITGTSLWNMAVNHKLGPSG
ncbi:hypothetical protein [Novosphingobium sp. Fuku2-ISO-50]|uniref:hypothetical protein n=1 Tax=Novosphingobium sp. Fuku2-ISO-50 TaxID=1739114 RepID=UPI000A8571B5|nr:hypothetical protein [Novosphingobium sp. Fuku2-ISO-50]